MRTRTGGTGGDTSRHGVDPARAQLPGPAVRLLEGESGVTAIEYGLVATLVGIAFIGGASLLGVEVADLYAFVRAAVTSVIG